MAGLKLDLQFLQENLGAYEDAINAQPIAIVERVAQLLLQSDDQNAHTQDHITNCKQYEGTFNDFTEGARKARADLAQYVDLAEFEATKAGVEKLADKDVTIDAGKVDTSTAMF